MRPLLQHATSRGIRGEVASPACEIARWVNLPSGGRFSNITEDVRKYAAVQVISEKEALHRGMKKKSMEFVETGGEA